jgi:hypothetical protein
MMLEYKKLGLVDYSMKFFLIGIVFITGLFLPISISIDDIFNNSF